jgi:hypothetical protein
MEPTMNKPSHYAPLSMVACFFLLAGLIGGCSPVEVPATEIAQPISVSTSDRLFFDFNGLPEGVPPDWQMLFVPFGPDSQPPEVIKAQAQQDQFMIENMGTFSGLYAIHTGTLPSPNLEIGMDMSPDGMNPMGVFLVCRYSEAGWYLFRISNGASAIQSVESKDGVYNVVQLVEGPGVFLDDRTHKLGAVCDGNQLSLLADGREVLSKEADFLKDGSFGFGVESFSNPGGRKAFDNVSVKFLAEKVAVQPSITPTEQVAALPDTPTPAPISTATSAPAAAPTQRSTLIPEDQLALYQTSFDNGDSTLADWKTFAYSMDERAFVTEGYETFISNGSYRFRQEANSRVFAIYDKEMATADVDLSTSGSAPYYEGGIGLVCRYNEAGWYQFMVEPNGIWSIRLVKPDENGEFHFHVISSGGKPLGSEVDLRAECKGDRLTFFIDGEKMASLHDSTFPTGKVGLLGWSFEIPGDMNMIQSFTVQRAQWNETGLPGPAPTPGPDGAIYSTDFANLDELNPYWAKVDIGTQGIPGSPVLVGGPGQPSPHTYLYFNDFDPGPDVEITGDVRGELNSPRGLICRYSEDGWYETFFMKDGPQYRRVALARVERDEQGKLTSVIIGTYYPSTPAAQVNLTLTCAGNQISVKADGEQVLYTEDNTWRTGRYGFLLTDNPPGNFRSNTLLNYTVRPAQSPKAGDVIYDAVFDTPEKIASGFNLNLEDTRLRIQENVLLLTPEKDALHPYTTQKYENGELSLDTEFLNASDIVLHCRSNSTATIGAEIRSNGDWNLTLNYEKMLANGNNASIQASKNQFILKCVNSQISLLANGERSWQM